MKFNHKTNHNKSPMNQLNDQFNKELIIQMNNCNNGTNQQLAVNEIDSKSILLTIDNDDDDDVDAADDEHDRGKIKDQVNNNDKVKENHQNQSRELTKKLYEKVIQFKDHEIHETNSDVKCTLGNDYETIHQRNIDSTMNCQINQTKVPYPSPQQNKREYVLVNDNVRKSSLVIQRKDNSILCTISTDYIHTN